MLRCKEGYQLECESRDIGGGGGQNGSFFFYLLFE